MQADIVDAVEAPKPKPREKKPNPFDGLVAALIEAQEKENAAAVKEKRDPKEKGVNITLPAEEFKARKRQLQQAANAAERTAKQRGPEKEAAKDEDGREQVVAHFVLVAKESRPRKDEAAPASE